MVVGITGSMACGKTYMVCKFLEIASNKGVQTKGINIDKIRRKIIKNNEKLNNLYKIAYNSLENMQKYKKMLLPLLNKEVKEIINSNKNKLIFLEWALLLEDNMQDLCDKIILVKCNKSEQLNRLKDGDLSLEQINQRLKMQLKNSEKLNLIKKTNKPHLVFDTTKNPSDTEYKKLFNSVLNANENDYSFCLFKIPQNGGRVLWEVTNLCNYNCVYCIFNSSAKKIDGELTTIAAKNVIKQLKEKGFSYIKFTGGEPFARQDMLELLKYASKLGFYTDISTNASLITKEMAGELAKLNLNYVHVSLDGHNKQTHELVRGDGTFERTINGIKLLVNAAVNVRLGCLIFKQNQDKLEDAIKLALSLNVNEIIFSFMEPIGRLDKNSPLISNLKISNAEQALSKLKQKYKKQIKVSYSFTTDNSKSKGGCKCPALGKFMFIDNLGYISPCTWLVDAHPEFKSKQTLKTASLEEILKSSPCKKCLEFVDNAKPNVCPAKRRG